MATTEKEINEQMEKDLKEIALWFGGWDELRKVIDELEQRDREAATDRHFSRDL